MSALTLLLVLLAIALVFDFLNGFHDSANVVATLIASRAMSARGALARSPRRGTGAEPETKLVEIRTLGALFRRVSAVESDRWRADLVVLGTHGRRGVSKLVLGSVADGVVRACGCPVLLVRPSARGGKRAARRRA
jgi:hypothetical protein